MSYAIQQIQILIIHRGGYADELDYIKKYKFDKRYCLPAFGEFIHNGLLSREYFEGKGHEVLGKFIPNSDVFEINQDVKAYSYEEAYSIEVEQGFIFKDDGKLYYVDGYSLLFVGSRKNAREKAKEIKEFYEHDPDYPIVHFRVRKIT